MEYKEFRVRDLFDWKNGNTDLKKEHLNGKGHFVVSAGAENMGIIGRTDVEARILPANTITIDMFGNVYFRDFEYKEVTHARVFTLIPKGFEIDVHTGLYLVSLLQKITCIFSYNNMCSYAKIADMTISLPVRFSCDTAASDKGTPLVEDIAWEAMADRIKDLETERIKELEAYLIAAGLDDYELTEEDKEILADKSVKYEDKLIGDLFYKVEAKCKKAGFDKRKDTSTTPSMEFAVPLLNAKLGNNGIMFYGRERDWNTQTMCIGVIQNGAVATGKVYAQPQPTAVLWDAYLIKPKYDAISEGILLYLAKCIEKLTVCKFSYDKKATWDRIKECYITVPITPSGTPDFSYMERYIKALEKLVIADVVKYKDSVIETTKAVVKED